MVIRKGKDAAFYEILQKEHNVMMAEEGGSLLPGLVDGYQELLESPLKSGPCGILF